MFFISVKSSVYSVVTNLIQLENVNNYDKNRRYLENVSKAAVNVIFMCCACNIYVM